MRDVIRFAPADASPVQQTLRQAVARYLATQQHAPYATPAIHAKGLLFAGLAAGFYTAMLAGGFSRLPTLLLGLGFAASVMFLILNISHEAAHGVLFRSRRLNRLTHAVVFNLGGVNARLWQWRHVRAHHPFPNVPGCDADVDHNPVLKLHPGNRHWPHFRWQHLYAPLAYMVGTVHAIFIQDLVYLAKQRLANSTQRVSAAQVAGFCVAKGVYLTLWLGLPLAVLPFSAGEILVGYGLCTGSMALIFLPVICTHFCLECSLPQPDATGRLPDAYLRHQLAAAMDWSPESRLARFLYGGLNLHAAHHLFPQVSHAYAPQITAILRRELATTDLPYHVDTLGGVLRSHFRLLRQLGRGAPEETC